MNITPHFSLEEMTVSQTAIRMSIPNIPDAQQRINLKRLSDSILEPLRLRLGKPVHISSGFRCAQLNTAIGGARNSQHTEGKAADISVSGLSTEELFQYIINSFAQYDQIIQEFDSWVHISWNDGHNRCERLRATKQGSKTVYTKV